MNMVSVKDFLPTIGDKVICRINFWRYGVIHHTEELEAEFLGINGATGSPMFDVETYDEAYAEVTHWKKG